MLPHLAKLPSRILPQRGIKTYRELCRENIRHENERLCEENDMENENGARHNGAPLFISA